MSLRLERICETLGEFAPLELAESWDNVGLLTGDPTAPISRVMTCLTITPDTAQEAVDQGADLVVTHHPLPFRPIQRIRTDETAGRLLWTLTRAGVAIYSAHTAWDSSTDGINQQIAQGLQLEGIEPLRAPSEPASALGGAGRWGVWEFPVAQDQALVRVAKFFRLEHLRHVPAAHQRIASVAVACGSAGAFLPDAVSKGCELLVTGETSFHTCLEAQAQGIGLVLVGHFASERFAMESLASALAERHPELDVWPSRSERDPIVSSG